MTTRTEELWLRRYTAVPAAGPRLVCFPHAGGAASFFLPVARALAGRTDVLAVQYPGRQDRRAEAPLGSIAELADRITEALRGYADRPLALFGHSMGAIVAFEVARRLEHGGGPLPVRLFASGRRAPSAYRAERVHRGDDRAVLAELMLLGGTETALLDDPELRAMVMPAIRADYRAIETYRHTPDAPAACPITVLTGASDPRTTMDEARAWAAHTTGPCEVRVFPGGHFFVSTASGEVIRTITEVLGGEPVAGHA